MINKINNFINTPKYYIPTVLLAGGIATALLYFGSSEATKIAGGSFAGLGGVIVLIKFKQWHAQHASKMIALNPQGINIDDDNLPEESEHEILATTNTVFAIKRLFPCFKVGFVDSKGNETYLSDLPDHTTLASHSTADNHFFMQYTSSWKNHPGNDQYTVNTHHVIRGGTWDIRSSKGELFIPQGNERIVDLLKDGYRVRMIGRISRK